MTELVAELVSLHSFYKDYGNLPKPSVRRRLNDNGYRMRSHPMPRRET
ncbi:hypothetical protein VB780_13900 [Leptolyngbya sp. CCNP1308]|nr:hypothetical protein [Leptolyngbya sp. CCNP1308]MEA5449674.1 hypothetical protein [Leptolyngbya sp. CCNP1308]